MAHQFDSCITRVRPFFQPLLTRDPTGLSWLPSLLRAGEANPKFAERLARDCAPLLDWISSTRLHVDGVLMRHGVPAVELHECFEHRVAPPPEFLRWLIENPAAMTWPLAAGEPTDIRREQLFGHHGLGSAAATRDQALAELNRHGAANSNGKWWAFEGCTRVDCYLETETMILLVEGKRTEPLSIATRWFPQRHQLVRNLDVARTLAKQKKKDYAVLLLAEQFMEAISIDDLFDGLPHLPSNQRGELWRHYLGCVTWSDALARVFFPHTVADAAKQILESAPVEQIG